MDSIATARDFFINQQGLSPNQAEEIISRGMEAYNERIQPQSMMQMASNGGRIGFAEGGLSEYELLKLKELGYNVKKEGTESFGGVSVLKDILKVNKLAGGGIARLGYQLGGLSTMPMDFGQSLQVPQQPQPNFSSATNITMNPLASYGQPELGQAGGTPLMMRGGGIARLGYESGGVTLPSQGSELSQMEGMDQQQALQTIIQILIENGIPPEQAQELALQIIQIFAQGGAPAVEAFADQLEQEEVQAMAGGGIAGLYPRQGYFVGKIVKAVSGAVKGVAKAVKSVAKSPIGRAALTVAAVYFGGPMLASGLGISSAAGAALAGGLGNTALQLASGQKFNPLEALTSAGGAYIGAGGLSNPTVPVSSATNITAPGLEAANYFSPMESQFAGPSQFTSPVPTSQPLTNYYSPTETMTAANVNLQQPNLLDKGIMAARQLTSDPLGTIKNLATSAYDYAKENPLTTAVGVSSLATLGSRLGMPRSEGESDEDYAKRLQEVQGYLTNYGRNLQIRNPYFYQREGAVNPFAPTMAGTTMADGGIARLGYKGAGMVSPRSNPTQQDELNQAALDVFKRPLHQLTPEEVDMLIEFIKEKFGKAPIQQDTTFAARGGSMIPPARQIEGGIIELDARKTGGYIPYGKKERVDDVPAMLAKDEFVFTSRAVKAAGDGSARRGAAKMYKLMKQLESKGMKMERGARA